MAIKMPLQYEMVESKKSSKVKFPSASTIKTRATEALKKTATATKERAKARGVAAGELAAGGLVAKVAATAVASAGATGVVLTAAPWMAGFAAAALAGGIIKTVTDSEKPENEN